MVVYSNIKEQSMRNANGIQIIGDRVYYKMELVATLNPMSASTAMDEFKRKLLELNKGQNQ